MAYHVPRDLVGLLCVVVMAGKELVAVEVANVLRKVSESLAGFDRIVVQVLVEDC